VNCKTASFLIDLVLPRAAELDAGERHELEAHLASCSACAAQARAGRLWDERLVLAMRSVPMPEGLSLSIKNRLRADHRRFLIRRRLVPLAAAAALLLVAGLLLWPRPLKLDTEIAVLEGAKQAAARAQVNAWLKLEGFPEAAPAEFNYNYLTWYGMAELNGRLTPTLFFVTSSPQGAVNARVHLLRKRRFDTSALGDVSGNLSMVVLRGREDVSYVVFYTGDLDSFVNKADGRGA
jgi:hypothetical protein